MPPHPTSMTMAGKMGPSRHCGANATWQPLQGQPYIQACTHPPSEAMTPQKCRSLSLCDMPKKTESKDSTILRPSDSKVHTLCPIWRRRTQLGGGMSCYTQQCARNKCVSEGSGCSRPTGGRDGLHSRNRFSHLEDVSPRSECQQSRFLVRPLYWLTDSTFSPCPTWPFLCVLEELWCLILFLEGH